MKNCYTFKFSGVWLPGYAVVWADDVEQAKQVLRRELTEDQVAGAEMTYRGKPGFEDQVLVLWNGDY